MTYSTATQRTPATQEDLVAIANLLKGHFTTAPQIEAEGGQGKNGHYLVEMHLVNFTPPAGFDLEGGIALYVEQGAPESDPYRQRIYHLCVSPTGQLINRVYDIADALPLAGAYKPGSPLLSQITLDRLTLMEGCEVLWEKEGNVYYGKSGANGTCAPKTKWTPQSKMPEYNCITSDIQLSEDVFISHDRGWYHTDGQMNYVWGPDEDQGGHQFTPVC